MVSEGRRDVVRGEPVVVTDRVVLVESQLSSNRCHGAMVLVRYQLIVKGNSA